MEQLYPDFRSSIAVSDVYGELPAWPLPKERPLVAVNMVSSIDGKITVNQEHQTKKIGSEIDRALMQQIRSHFDAVLRGAETVRQNPGFPGVPEELARRRASRGTAPQPRAVIASRSLNVPTDGPIFQGERPIILTTHASNEPDREGMSAHADVVLAGEEELDALLVLKTLREGFGIERLLVEGGSRLNDLFFRAGMVDVLFWTLAPTVIGNGNELTMVEGASPIEPPVRMKLERLNHHEGELYFCWSSLSLPS